MDLPLSIVLFHILAIKIRYRSCSCCLFVYLFVPSTTYHQSIHVGFSSSHGCGRCYICFFPPPPFPKQDADVVIFLCLNYSYLPDADVYQLLFVPMAICGYWVPPS